MPKVCKIKTHSKTSSVKTQTPLMMLLTVEV